MAFHTLEDAYKDNPKSATTATGKGLPPQSNNIPAVPNSGQSAIVTATNQNIIAGMGTPFKFNYIDQRKGETETIPVEFFATADSVVRKELISYSDSFIMPQGRNIVSEIHSIIFPTDPLRKYLGEYWTYDTVDGNGLQYGGDWTKNIELPEGSSFKTGPPKKQEIIFVGLTTHAEKKVQVLKNAGMLNVIMKAYTYTEEEPAVVLHHGKHVITYEEPWQVEFAYPLAILEYGIQDQIWTKPQETEFSELDASFTLANLTKTMKQRGWIRPTLVESGVAGQTTPVEHAPLEIGNLLKSYPKYLEFLGTEVLPSTTVLYSDFTFQSFVADNEKAQSQLTGLKNKPVSVTPVYSYFQPLYEPNIEEPGFFDTEIRVEPAPEIFLPNIYSFLSFLKDPSKPFALKYKKQILLGPKEKAPLNKLKNNISLKNLNNYFKLWAKSVKHMDKSTREDFENSNRIMGISPKHIDLLKSAEEYKDRFPMYVDIKINTQGQGKFVEILKEADLYDDLMKITMYATAPLAPQDKPTTLFSYFRENTQKAVLDTGLQTLSHSFFQENLLTLNVEAFLYNYFYGKLPADASSLFGAPSTPQLEVFYQENAAVFTVPVPYNKYITMFGVEEKDEKIFAFNPGNNFLKSFKLLKFKGKLGKFLKEKVRSVEEIYNGKPAYSEILFYEIVKFLKTETGLHSGQSFFVPNDSSLNIINYIDTQVKRNQKYVYEIYAHQVVVGTNYKYSGIVDTEGIGKSPQTKPDIDKSGQYIATTEPGQIQVSFDYRPSIYLIRAPYHNTAVTTLGEPRTTTVDDSPPVWPNVNIVPYRGINNKVLILLNPSIDDLLLTPVMLDNSEKEIFDDMIEKQKDLHIKLGKINYKSDDTRGMYEIYRIDEEPTSYFDFSPMETTRIARFNSTNQTSFVDKIQPNRNYYYTFRMIDIHNNPSNPTPIYLVRIIDEPGVAPYTIIKTITMKNNLLYHNKT